MSDLKIDFRDYLVNTKKVSENTLQSYMRDIEGYFHFLDSRNISPADVDSAIIKKYTETISATGRSQATVSRVIATLRCFYNYLIMEGIVTENPAKLVKSAKVEKKLPQILTTKEVELLLAQPDISDMKGCRDKAMFELLYATGIRVSELIDLDVDDVNLQIGMLRCKSGKAERLIPIYDEAQEAIADYLLRVRNAVISDYTEKALFTNMNGSRMTRQGFWKIIKSYAKLADIKKDITPHTLRHSFATHLMENGADINDIKEMLGHSDISSTHVYTRIIKERYRSAYVNCHPKAKHA